MKNVFDIKKEKNLNYFLPIDRLVTSEKSFTGSRIIVIIHLHYDDTLEDNMHYIENIPLDFDILFTTSSESIEQKLFTYKAESKRNFEVIKKENRGRDISGLLVACRKKILQYEYVCFVHDKGDKSDETKQDVALFKKCLWENTLGSRQYIMNIIETFRCNPSLGVLLPPETVSGNYSFFFRNTWDRDFELMLSLANSMTLDCDLNKEKKPLSLGSFFWARVSALKKLFEQKWNYDDFDEEPLDIDGTISHAIERSFAYIAQDAGYDTGIVMTDQFAGKRMDYVQDILTVAFDCLNKTLGISTVNQLHKYNELLTFVDRHTEVYIYGAGVYGKHCARLLCAVSHKIKAFVVSSREGNPTTLEGIKIIPIKEVDLSENSGIIIAVSDKYRDDVLHMLKMEKVKNVSVYFHKILN